MVSGENIILYIGEALAITGSLVSIIGVYENNISRNHFEAMQIWALSNPILFFWSVGIWQGWWDGGISGAALAGLYGVFTTTNLYGLLYVK